MVVNHGSTLSIDYFKSYFRLILNTRTTDIDEAKVILFDHLFKNKADKFGETTYEHFLKAYEEMKA